MSRHPLSALLPACLFLAGLLTTGWIGAGYLVSNPAGALVTAVIAACYIAGAVELYRYRQATATLAAALDDVAAARDGLPAWLERLHPSLRHAVRLRIEGERAALPAPALTPYLVGLLVLLGMLGTLLGMMATLSGTGLALESTADLQAIRGALAAPVKGLAFAFGTSIAGVASSAALGLLSALVRRERLLAVQRLDAEAATTLRIHSQAWQRDEAFRLLQQQAGMMPALVDRLQAVLAAVEQQGASTGERLLAGQEAFHVRTEAAYAQLSGALQQSLQAGVAESARAVGAALQPAMETTMAGIARHAAQVQDSVGAAVQRQLDGLAEGFSRASDAAAGSWVAALAGQQRANEALAGQLQQTLDGFSEAFEQRSAALVDGVAARLDRSAEGMDQAWQQALAAQDQAHQALATRNAQALDAAAAGLEQQSATLLASLQASHARLQATLAEQDDARLEAWASRLAATSTALREDWERAGAQVAAQQQAVCDTLARTAGQITEQAQAHAGQTIAEISRLVQAASEAPRAAAEVVAELRQKLSDSMVRDTAMLEERTQLIGTLGTLLDAVNHASTEQRGAIDALVATSAGLLEQVGSRFTDHVRAETGRLGEIAAQVAAGATEVASLGDALGGSVQAFGDASQSLLVRLDAIGQALERAQVRSDEQLAYYVAQAREVVDLSVLAQQQIIEDLQRVAGAGTAGAAAGTQPA